ncbi:MAG: hypothetical protein ACW99R_14405 [Candidatus Hodarchaeales archaeon]|jgi:hypothetical protein
MLRKEFPFKISLAGCPKELITRILQFTSEKQLQRSFTPPRYEKKMDIESVSVRLHIKQLKLENEFTSSRFRDFQSSIEMIYIFEIDNISCFNKVKTDFFIFENLYKTVEIHPYFLGMGHEEDFGVSNQIRQELDRLNLRYQKLELKDNNSFTQQIRSIVSKSKTFQSTTQGSCDIDLE